MKVDDINKSSRKRVFIFWANVKEHATLSAVSHVDHGVEVGTTKDHVNRAADRVAVSRLVRVLVTVGCS